MGMYCHGCSSLYDEVKRLERKLAKNPWTSVKDGLPKTGEAVFVWRPGSVFPIVGFRKRVSKFDTAAWKVGGLSDKTVTHWAPMLPGPESE